MNGWMSTFGWWFDKLRTRELECQPDEDPRIGEDVTAEPEPEPMPWRLRSVGAWVGRGTFGADDTSKRDLKFAKDIGLGRLDVIVNDHSSARHERVFDTYKRRQIVTFCRNAVDQGFSVHLMTWWMPHENYIREGSQQIIDLVGETGAKSVQLDAEEPWTKARRPMDWEEASELTAEALEPVTFGVTGIGYTPSKKLGPLVSKAQYMVPQCYSTSGNKLDPATACATLTGRWRRLFGDRELVVGLAAYRQKGRLGYTKGRFMTEAFHAAEATSPTDIVYWSLRHIRGSSGTAKIIKGLSQRASHRADSA